MDFRGPTLAEYTVNKFVEIISSYQQGSRSKNYHKQFIIDVLSCFDLPIPSEVFLKYSNYNLLVFVIAGLSDKLLSEPYVTSELFRSIQAARNGSNLLALDISNGWYRLRTFNSDGYYPNTEFARQESTYRIIRGRPYLLTKNFHGPEELALGGNDENSVLSRKEVKLIASFMCAEHLGGSFSLVDDIESSHVLDVNLNYLDHIGKKDIIDVLLEYASIMGRINFALSEAFEFVASWKARSEVINFFDGFKINDPLLLRTAFLLIKASSMAMTRNYYEDAVSNIFIGLEGAMMLLQREDSIQFESIDRKFQKVKFKEIFTNGENVYDFVMDEVFARGEKRASLVHPQAGTDWSWVPYLNHEDYKDYRNILRELLHYVVTNEKYEEIY